MAVVRREIGEQDVMGDKTMNRDTKGALRCPECKSRELQPGRYGKSTVELDACGHCRGIWFDCDEFHQIFEVGAIDFRCERNARPTRWRCPRCARALRRRTYPQTDVDILICIDCDGLWTTPEQILAIRQQRLRLRRTGKLKQHAPVIGSKGRWIAYVNRRIERLQREYAR